MTAEDFEAVASEALGALLVMPNGNPFARRGKMMKALKAGGVETVWDAAVLMTWVASWCSRPIGIQTIAYKSAEWLPKAIAEGKLAPKKGPATSPTAPLWGSGIDE